MTFQAVQKTEIDAVTVAPYAKVRHDGSIEYGVLDHDGDPWKVAVLSTEGVLKTESYVSGGYTGIGDLKVTQGGYELTKVQPAPAPETEPYSFTDSKGRKWSFIEDEDGVDVRCDNWYLVNFDESGMERYSLAVGKEYKPAIAADPAGYGKVLVKDITPAKAPAPESVETDKVHTLSNGTTVELRTFTNEPELIINGVNKGWFMSDGDGETVFRLRGKFTNIPWMTCCLSARNLRPTPTRCS